MSAFTSVFDNDLILPGAITEISSDYNYGYDTSKFGKTEAVTIVGTAFNGPVGTPVPVYSPDHARYIFGNSYDSVTRKEATLVAGVQDAWDRGCTTIYAVRLSGTSITKDFQLAQDTTLKLRVSGMFPSNANKNIYMSYDNSEGAEAITIYKPASRATINEKMSGAVESENSILSEVINLNNTYGLTKESRLVELINVVNQYSNNNVLRLSIVDETGADVTVSSSEAQSLSVGVLFPGAYFIGRDKNIAIAETDLTYIPIVTAADKPFESFSGLFYKKLNLNTDVTLDLPIYASTLALMNKKIYNTGVQMSTMWDILSVSGKIDGLFGQDEIDYEQTDISSFEIYKALGSGFATAAKAVYKSTSDPSKGIKVIEAPVSDPNRIVSINDGIYSMLENLKSPYRVLMNGTVDGVIKGKIPRKVDFEISLPNSYKAMAGYITAKAVVDRKNLYDPKSYSFSINVLDPSKLPTSYSQVYMTEAAKRVSLVSKLSDITANDATYPNGTLFLVPQGTEYVLYRYSDSKLTVMTDSVVYSNLINKLLVARIGDVETVLKGAIDTTDPTKPFVAFNTIQKKDVGDGSYSFMLVESDGIISVYTLATTGALTPLGEISEVFSTEDDKTIVSIQSNYKTKNDIAITSNVLDYVTLSEFVDLLNSDENLAQYFTFSVNEDHVAEQDEYVQDIIIQDFNIAHAQSLGYMTGDKVLYHDVEYVAKSNIAKTVTAFEVSTDGSTGWNPVDPTITVWKASKSYSIGDVVISTDADPKPYECIISHSAAAGATFGDDITNFTEYIYREEKTLGYDMNLYIPFKTTDNFARHLAQHCTYTSLKNDPTHGIIGCDKLLQTNISSVAKKVDSLLALDTNYYAKKSNGRDMLDNNNLPYPIGRCLSVIFGQYVEVDDATSYNFISNAAAGYAGMLSQLSLEQSSTNQPITIPTPMFDLTNYQLTQLTQKGIVTFKNSFTGNYVITDGITLAPTTSPFRRLAITRIVNYMEEVIREACDPFIGKQNSLSNRNSMQTAIKSSLEAMKGTLLSAYDFKLLTDVSSTKLGIVYIDYNVVPIYEIREVRSRISIKDSL